MSERSRSCSRHAEGAHVDKHGHRRVRRAVVCSVACFRAVFGVDVWIKAHAGAERTRIQAGHGPAGTVQREWGILRVTYAGRIYTIGSEVGQATGGQRVMAMKKSSAVNTPGRVSRSLTT
jgi:hypothetical protein